MISYREKCKRDVEKNLHSDYWTGELHKDQTASGLFPNDTDMAFLLTSDGVKVFKTRDDFSI